MGFCRIFVIILVGFAVSFAQNICIFGPGEYCHFLCGCQQTDNPSVSCNSTSGDCFSGHCLSEYNSTHTGDDQLCLLNSKVDLLKLEEIRVFLVFEDTKERITDNVLPFQRNLRSFSDYVNESNFGRDAS